MYPRLVINLTKLRHNAGALVRLCAQHGITDLGFVTKVFTADEAMVRVLAQSGCRYLADSRVENLRSCAGAGKERILLRLTMPSQAEDVVDAAEISFQSEERTLSALNEAAKKAGKNHRVVLMIDLGDLREGIIFRDREKIFSAVDLIEAAPNLTLYGAAFNLTCYGSVLPTVTNLTAFMEIVEAIEARIGRRLSLISGGNSSSLTLMDRGEMPPRVNNLRLGEALVLGRETAYGQDLPGLYQDVVTLEAEIVEVQTKPSHPIGEIGVNAFGESIVYEDIGDRRRAIAAVGRQDMDCDTLTPLRPGVSVIGASSDHLILDVTDCAEPAEVGQILSFRMTYGGLLRGFTSRYVDRSYETGGAS